MSASSANEPSVEFVRLLERCPLDLAGATRVFEQLLDLAIARHEQGMIHGHLTADRVLLDGELCVRVLDDVAPESISQIDDRIEPLPPEFDADYDWDLPSEIASIRVIARKHDVEIEPQRIDVFQLGTILCQLLTGRDAQAYLKSPRARGSVPEPLRPLIDEALGYDSQHRIADCKTLQERFAVALEAVSSECARLSGPAHRSDTPAFGLSPASGQDTPITVKSEDGSQRVAPSFDRLGPYKIIARIGSGGMGDVYQAYEEALDRDVAIKVLPAELARHDDFVRRFRAEAMAVAKLVHPNIVHIHAIGEDAGHHYFVMQFVKGESLAQLLKRRKRLPVAETLAIAEQCLQGLAVAHQRQLIHRDVKPGNILIEGETNRVLMVDFGLVKQIQSDSPLTATGAIMGTLDYIPPEQALGMPVDGRADLYSIGVVTYQMLSGQLPFSADSPTSMAFQHAYEQPTPLGQIAGDVPRRVAAIVTRLMAKNPKHRYQTAAEVLDDIAAFRAGKPPARSPRGTAASGISLSASLPPMEAPGDFTGAADWAELAKPTSDRGWLDRIVNLFRRSVRDLTSKLENTEQQVDGAIQQYQHRANELRRLVRDSEDLIAELSAQVASHREASEEAARNAEASDDPTAIAKFQAEKADYERVAAEFGGQLREQTALCEHLRSQLAEANATLTSLQSQRDILHARLQSAQARIGMCMEAGPIRIKPALVTIGILAALALVAFAGLLLFRQSAPATVATSATHSGPVEFPLGQWVDVQSLIDVSRDTVRGEWLRKGTDLLSIGARYSRVEFPITVDGSYDFEVEFTRPTGDNGAAVVLSIGSHPFMVTLGGWNGAASGVMLIRGQEALNPTNPASIRPGTLVNGHRYRLSISARMLSNDRGSVDVLLDEKSYLPHWEGSLSDLSMPNYTSSASFPKRIEIGAGKSEVIFHSARLRMISGVATFAPAGLNGPTIISAHWGTGKKWADVTMKVRERVDKGLPIFATTSVLKADPAKGWKKELHIKYERNGTESQLTIPEGGKWTASQYGRLGRELVKPSSEKSTQ